MTPLTRQTATESRTQESTMEAVTLPDFGAPLSLRRLEAPAPRADEVRVRVESAGVNGIDLALASGYLKGMLEHRFPVVLGREFAGVVDAVGSDVAKFKTGDEVFGVVPLAPAVEKGAWAQYAVLPENGIVAKKPRDADFNEAAALPWAGMTAIQSIDALQLRKGDRVLIVGATGGVGGYAVQLAARSGAHVIATARPSEETYVRNLGAEETLDYSKGNLPEVLRRAHSDGLDAILDLASPAQALAELVKQLRPGGRAASTLGALDAAKLAEGELKGTNVMMNPNLEHLERLGREFDESGMCIPVQRAYPMREFAQAIHGFRGGTLGKILLSPNRDS